MFENLTYPYMGVGGVKNYQNHPYVISEWPQSAHGLMLNQFYTRYLDVIAFFIFDIVCKPVVFKTAEVHSLMPKSCLLRQWVSERSDYTTDG